MSLPLAQKKDWAKLLFLKENLLQKEIAVRVGVTEKTLSKWVNTEQWELLRASIIITKEESLRRIYMQINELNTSIMSKDEGKRFADSKEADALNKLAATARLLESDASLAETIEVFKQLLNFIKKDNLETAQLVGKICDDFIKDKLK